MTTTNTTSTFTITAAPPVAPVAPVAPVEAPVTNPGEPGPGRTFETLLTVEGRWTGDERIIMAGALTWDGLLPMPLTISHDDHPDAVTGIVTEIERRPGPTPDERLIVGRGIFDDGFDAGLEVLRKIEGGFLRGVSVDIDTIVEGGIDPAAVETDPNAGWRSVVETARIRALALTSLPAFAEAYITLDVVDTASLPPAPDPSGPAPLAHDDPKITAAPDQPILEPVVLAAGTGYRVVTAAPAIDAPPFDWFANPSFVEPTALTITSDGHVFGHIALWGTCHTGITGQCVTPPVSNTNYAGFLLGEVLCSDGARVPVGHLTVGTGHADPELGWRPAADHYDRTGTAVADVFAGEDPYGIWVAGAVRSTASASEVAALRASPISGDWRRMGTNLELVAALAVNVPGFPVHRVRSMVASGVQVSLVAAGVLDAKTLTRARARAAAERIAATIGRDRGSLAAGLIERVHPKEGA